MSKRKEPKSPFKPEFKYPVGTYIMVESLLRDRFTLNIVTVKEVLKITEYTWYSRSNVRYVCQTQDGSYRYLDKKYLEDNAVPGERKTLEALYGKA